jgi:hypothetical protein
MSRTMDVPEQDVGVSDGDGLPTYENLAQAHGPNSRCAYLYDDSVPVHGTFNNSFSFRAGSADGRAG